MFLYIGMVSRVSPDFKLMGQAFIYKKQKVAGLEKVELDLGLHLRTTPGTDICTLVTLVQIAKQFRTGLGGEGDITVSFSTLQSLNSLHLLRKLK